MSRLVLASTSRYRRELLQRLRLAFDTARPDVDETALPGDAPFNTAADQSGGHRSLVCSAKKRKGALRRPLNQLT